MTAHATLRLKPKAERRLKSGHLWVYSNEVDIEKTPLKPLEPGSQAVIESSSGKVLGTAVVSPSHLIDPNLFDFTDLQPTPPSEDGV